MVNLINAIPDFTDGGNTAEEVNTEEGKPREEASPPEKPAEGTEDAGQGETETTQDSAQVGDNASKLANQIQGLQGEREKLLKEIQTLRGERRELKQQEIDRVETKIVQTKDELADVQPEDVQVIERVLRAKGFVTKDEAARMNYDQAKQAVLDEFLNKYPEFKTENDPTDLNWNALQRELSLYKTPQNPRDIMGLLERARKAITPAIIGEPNAQAVKRQIETASRGAGGGMKGSSPSKMLDPGLRSQLHGFSEEEIKNIEKNLNK